MDTIRQKLTTPKNFEQRGAPATDTRPSIRVVRGELHRVLSEVRGALKARGETPLDLHIQTMLFEISARVRFLGFNKTAKDWRPIDPPREIVRELQREHLALYQFRAESLNGAVFQREHGERLQAGMR